MISPLRTRYHLLQQFKSLRNARFFILPLHQVGVLVESDEPVDLTEVSTWLKRFNGFEEYLLANDNPALLEDGIDIEEEAEALVIDLDDLMDQQTNDEGFTRFLSKHLDGVAVYCENRFQFLVLYIPDDYLNSLTDQRKDTIRRLARLLLCNLMPIEFWPMSKKQTPDEKQYGRDRMQQLAQKDREVCLDQLAQALSGISADILVSPLGHRFALFVDNFSDGLDLQEILSVADTVYVAIPPDMNTLERKFNTSPGALTKAVESGRLVPVIENPFEVYDRKYLDRLLGSAARAVLPGELRLRIASATHRLEPLVSQLERRSDDGLELLRRSNELPGPLQTYVSAANDCAIRLRDVLWELGPLLQAYFPLIKHSDHLARELILKEKGRQISERSIEFGTAYRGWLIIHALRAEVALEEGDSMLPYWGWYFGRSLSPPLFTMNERVRWLVARLGALKAGHSLAEQASAVLDSKAVGWIRELLESPRLLGLDWKQKFLEVEEEERQLRGRLDQRTWALWVLGFSALFAGKAWGLAIPAAFEILKNLSEAPGIDERLKMLLARPSNEARLLYKIRTAI